MGNSPRPCTPYVLSRDEELIIQTMYSRPPGNVDPDRDPAGFTLLRPPASMLPGSAMPDMCPDAPAGLR